MLKAEMKAEIERLKDKCDRQARMLAAAFPDKSPYDTFFICGEGGEKDANGLPDRVHICPAYGCDFSEIYQRVGRGAHPEW